MGSRHSAPGARPREGLAPGRLPSAPRAAPRTAPRRGASPRPGGPRPQPRAARRLRLRRWTSLVFLEGAQAGLTPFGADPVDAGAARFQNEVFISEYYLEHDNGSCSSIAGPQCSSLHGRPQAVAPGGIFSLFGSLRGDPGFFVQDEVGPYFASPAALVGQEGGRSQEEAVPPTNAGQCLRVAFDGVQPHEQYLPTFLNITRNLSMEALGTFALRPTAFLAGMDPRRGASAAPRVYAEVQDTLACLRFDAPVVVEQIWLAHRAGLPTAGAAASAASAAGAAGAAAPAQTPVVLRGRLGSEELWSAYLRAEDFRSYWVSPQTLVPLPVSEVAILGGEGLLVASLWISQGVPGRAGAGDHEEPGVRGRHGWLFKPTGGLRSMHDVGLSRLPLPSAAAVLSVAEVYQSGHLRLRSSIFDEAAGARGAPGGALGGGPEATEEALGAEPPAAPGVVGVAGDASASAAEAPTGGAAGAEAQDAQRPAFFDGRTVAGMRSLLDALGTGALPFPRDIPLDELEADIRLYADSFAGVTLEEAVNARSLDELYERLFTANRVDALDLLFLRFLWANYTSSLRSPGGTVPLLGAATTSARSAAQTEEDGLAGGNGSMPTPAALLVAPPAAPPAAPAAASMEVAKGWPLAAPGTTGQRLRSMVSNLRRHTSAYARWRRSIEHKVSFLNKSAAVDTTFTIYDSARVGLDYYNGASGRGQRMEIQVPDAEYLLAEMLGLESEFLVDHRGRPLPEARATREHKKRTFIDELGRVLLELQQNTSEVPEEPDEAAGGAADAVEGYPDRGLDLLLDGAEDAVELSMDTPPLLLALAVPGLVVGAVLGAAFLPAPQMPRWMEAATARSVAFARRAHAARARLAARLGLARGDAAQPVAGGPPAAPAGAAPAAPTGGSGGQAPAS